MPISTRNPTPFPNLLPLFEWGGAQLLAALTVERCLVLLGCALTEQKVIFVSKDTSKLGSSVLAFVSLLAPLTWCGPLIPILPSELHHILDAPFPLIAGVTQLTTRALKQRQDDAVVVNLDKGRILLPSSVNEQYFEFKLPKCELLSHELQLIYAKDQKDQRTRLHPRRNVSNNKMMEMSTVVHAAVVDILDSVLHHEKEMLKELNPFLARVADTQMCSHWRQHHECFDA